MIKTLSRTILAALVLAGWALAQGPGPGPGPLPPPPVPAGNPITPAKAVLGKILFWDEQLSSDNTVACGTCHQFTAGGGDPRIGINPGPDGLTGTADDKFASPGVTRSDASNDYLRDPVFAHGIQVTRRAAPTMINAAYAPQLFWDGRATNTFFNPQTGAVSLPAAAALESQAAAPPLANAEMAHDLRAWPEIIAKLSGVRPLKLASALTPDITAALAVSPTYPQLFQAAFGTPFISGDRIARALATYQRTLIANQTPFDAFIAGNPMALTPQQANGLMVFNGPGRCNVCHAGPTLTNHTFRNLGLRPVTEDEGRFEVTANPADRGRFKVPTLRNAALRPRFMHNGQFTTLMDVVDFYGGGGGPFPLNRDPVLATIAMSPAQRANVVALLTGAFTDPRVAAGLPPFDRPTLFSETAASAPILVGPGTAGSGGLVPTMLATTPANIGNVDFRLGVGDVPPLTIALLGASPFELSPGTTSFGVSLVPDLTAPGAIVETRTTSGLAPNEGHATVRFPIPNVPFLIGTTFTAQWFLYDPASVAAIDFTSSQAARITIF